MVGGGRSNLSEVRQEETAQMRDFIHWSLCLGERTSSEMTLKCQQYLEAGSKLVCRG